MALRARSPQALERRVAALKGSEFESAGPTGIWGTAGVPLPRSGRPFVELYYETEWYQAPAELKPALKNQAQRFPARGVNVRRLDHLNCSLSTSRPTGSFLKLSRLPADRADRAQRRHRSRDVDDDVEQEL